MSVRGAAVLLLALLGANLQGQEAARPAYPEGYRSWVHSKSMVVQEGHFLYPQFGGIHHIYANPKAFAALPGGKPCPDGCVLVLDVLGPSKPAPSGGARRFVKVMEKRRSDSRARGWGTRLSGDSSAR
jgi:hypothetical protein